MSRRSINHPWSMSCPARSTTPSANACRRSAAAAGPSSSAALSSKHLSCCQSWRPRSAAVTRGGVLLRRLIQPPVNNPHGDLRRRAG